MAMGGLAVVVLAAGGSSRMGSPKQLLPVGGTSLLRRATLAAVSAAASGPVVVVLGPEPDRMRVEVANLPVIVAENADWVLGMGGSIRVGVAAALAVGPSVRAVLVTLCDQPDVGAVALADLVAAFDRGPHPIAAAGYAGTVGVPAAFGHPLFARLLALPPDAGAKALLRGPDVTVVPLAAAAADVDTPAEYRDVLARAMSPAEIPRRP